MGFLNKLGDIVTKPIEIIAAWVTEPLKRAEYERNVEREIKIINAKANNRIKEKTEIKRILVEIEELKKDKEFERMKAVSEAIMKYQKELTKLNVSAINAIGNMQLELREKAQQLVYEKTISYKKLQDQAINESMDDLKRIENDFSGNDKAKNILISAVDKRLANIIDTAYNFLIELNDDIRNLNKDISILSERGQIFVIDQLEELRKLGKYDIIESTTNEIKEIEDKNG